MSDDVTKRMNYFDRQFLHKEDFQVEQAYHIDRHRRHNRALHVAGVAAGMDVTGRPGDSTVTINPGMAIDPDGRDIVLAKTPTPVTLTVPLPNVEGAYDLYIYYDKEQETDPSRDPGVDGNTRIEERPGWRLVDTATEKPLPNDLRLARLHVKGGKLASEPDETGTVRSLAGAKMGGDFEAHKLTLAPYPPTRLAPEQRPTLTCNRASTLNVDPQGAGGILIGKPSGTAPGGFTNLSLEISAASGGYSSLQSIKASGTNWGDLWLDPIKEIGKYTK